ncbi:class I SAM-dependent methyltransferase [candidate division WOR-3 bacterium]|nr:class I SAM-dependent methyltransferase [Candidatus Parcubacteria bacterium]MCK4528467.1 class I SAM-dependent methyltransferase [candidate division WOR-3 bacterium]
MKTIHDVKNMKHLLTHEEIDYLYSEASALRPGGSVVNIGVYHGASAAALACGMKAGTLIIVDVFKYHNAGFPKMIPFRERTDVKWTDLPEEEIINDLKTYLGDTTLEVFKMYSDDVSLFGIPMIDLLFIDGDHTEHTCLLDTLKYSQILNNGGKILFHDYTSFKQVRDAIHKFLNIRSDFKFERQVNSIYTLKKE